MPVLERDPVTFNSVMPILGFDNIYSGYKGPWIVVVYNDDVHSFNEVIHILQKATGCSLESAQNSANKIHHEDRAVVFEGEENECRRVADIIASIKLQVDCYRV